MAAIGYVTRTDTGSFKGLLNTLTIKADIEIVPNTNKANDVQPDYRVLAGGVEIGAAWNRRSETTGRDYVSLSRRPESAAFTPNNRTNPQKLLHSSCTGQMRSVFCNHIKRL
ncbi:MAG: DUF736 family protein [Sphingomonadaceae bacterium]|nr:DUF736 family protein [Sphingomonadaceae bacterium]